MEYPFRKNRRARRRTSRKKLLVAYAPVVTNNREQKLWPEFNVRVETRSRRRLSNARLDGSEDRFPNRGRKLNWGEVTCGIEVIVTRLVDDAKLAMFRGICVRQYLINLVKFERNFVAPVLQAYNKLLGRCFHRNSVNVVALDLQLSAADAMSFIPVYLRQRVAPS